MEGNGEDFRFMRCQMKASQREEEGEGEGEWRRGNEEWGMEKGEEGFFFVCVFVWRTCSEFLCKGVGPSPTLSFFFVRVHT